MIFKEWLRFIYGMAMGTSVPYIKPSNRFLWPTAFKKFDENLSLFLGGSCICAILHDETRCCVINTNSGSAATQLHKYIESLRAPKLTLINTSSANDFSGGNKLYPDTVILEKKTDKELEIDLDFEKCIVVPIVNSASKCDFAIYLVKRKILFLGPLFYNHIHPILRPLEGMNVSNWIQNLEALLLRFQPEMIVPAEGEPAGARELGEFISYLRALSSPSVEFSECRKTYDWMEIPGQTSLEENFDLIRENIRSFAKF